MSHPPKLGLRFLRWFCREDYLEEIEGDLVELFELRLNNSVRNARFRFYWDVIRSFRLKNIKILNTRSTTMNQLSNYTKIYFRLMRIEKTHYAFNIMGLALGFAVLMFILLYTADEKNIDHYHSKIDRIYRVIETSSDPEEGVKYFSATANPLAEALKADFPEIEESAKMIYMGSMTLKNGDRLFQDRNYAYVTPGIFNILDFDLTAGDPLDSFNGPVGAVLTESMAIKLFPDETAVGKIIEIPGKFDQPVEVIATVADLPTNSTYQFKTILVVNFDKINYLKDYWSSWDSRGMTTLVLFDQNARPQDVLAKKDAFLSKYYEAEIRDQHDFSFQPYADMHLGSDGITKYYTEPLKAIAYSNQDYLRIVLLIGIIVVVIAALNFVNLSSVQALKRLHESGIRKINGATPGQLRVQLVLETLLTVCIAYTLALLLVFGLFDKFLEICNKDILLSSIFSTEMVLVQLVLIIGVSLLSSAIPSAYFSKADRSALMSKKNIFSGKGNKLRHAFILVQYSISLLLVVGSLILYQQLEYVKSKNLGFSMENIITWDINSDDARDNQKLILEGLKSSAHVVEASISSRVPGEWKSIIGVQLAIDHTSTAVDASHFAVDASWIGLYGMRVVQGSNFRGVTKSDSMKAILNQTAVQALGIANPIGQSIEITRRGKTHTMQVIGVLEDFHFESMYDKVTPVVLTSLENPIMGVDYYCIKHDGNVERVLNHVTEISAKYDPGTAAELNFLDQKWERYYKADDARSTLVFIATMVSILISVFGLFGLVSFTVGRKTKELGIRKVLGATAHGIVANMSKGYLFLLLVAFLFSAPLAYWLLSAWLENFAYRISLTPLVFLAAFGFVMIITLVTVTLRVYRVAVANPVESLRNE